MSVALGHYRVRESASLYANFAQQKSLTPLVGPAPTFSRASDGYRTDESGLIMLEGIDAPRFDHAYENGEFVSKGLLIEEARTNNLLWSQDFSTWTNWNTDFTSNYAVAPDGAMTATRFKPIFVEDPGGSSKTERVYRSFSTVAGEMITYSVYVKPINAQSLYVGNPDGADIDADLRLGLNGDQSGGISYFNLRTLAVETIAAGTTSASMLPVGNGWYRCSITYTAAATDTSNNHFVYFTNRTAFSAFDPYPSGNEEALFWQADSGLGAYSASPYPTTTAAATRAADAISWTGTDFTNLYHPTTGSVVWEGVLTGGASGSNRHAFSFYYNNSTNMLGGYHATSISRWIFRSGNSSDVTLLDGSTGFSIGQPVRLAMSWDATGLSAAVNGVGGSVVSANTILTPYGLTLLRRWSTAGSVTDNCSGHVRSFRYWPGIRHSEAELKRRTAI